MKILVVGGAGFIGSVLCRELLESNIKVRVLDNLSFGGESLLPFLPDKRFELYKGDIRNRTDVTKSLHNIDQVINLAALVGEHACAPQPAKAWDINYKAAVFLASQAKKNRIAKFIFISTCSNYGISNPEILADEQSPLNPVSLYAQTKVKAEKDILDISDSKFCTCVLRLATVFGISQRMRFDLLLNELVRDAFVNKSLLIFQPHAWRPLINVNDVCRVIFKSIKAPTKKLEKQVFNVGLDNFEKIELAKLVKKKINNIHIEISEKKTDKRDYCVSFKKMRKVFNFKPEIDINTGINELTDHLIQGIFPDPMNFRYSNLPWPKK